MLTSNINKHVSIFSKFKTEFCLLMFLPIDWSITTTEQLKEIQIECLEAEMRHSSSI